VTHQGLLGLWDPKLTVRIVILLIFLSALPDALVVPVLKDLFADRYGVSTAQAQLFLAVNLLGALLAIPLVKCMRQRMSGWAVVSSTAIVDGILLAIMWLPIGFAGTLALRTIEGAVDVATFAALFQMLGRSDQQHRAWKLGLGATVLVAGLGIGAVLGGFLTKLAGSAAVTLIVGSVSCVSTGILAIVFRSTLERMVQIAKSSTVDAAMDEQELQVKSATQPAIQFGKIWPILFMAATDRATGAILTAVFASFLLSGLGYTPEQRGMLVGLPLLLMAIGAAPAGWFADRFGALRTRTLAAIVYAIALGIVPFLGANTLMLALALLILGVAAAPLLPASLALVLVTNRGMSGLAAFRAAGDIGYFTGIVVTIATSAMIDAGQYNVQTGLVCGFALLHLVATTASWLALREHAEH
jgi:MFS family permease